MPLPRKRNFSFSLYYAFWFLLYCRHFTPHDFFVFRTASGFFCGRSDCGFSPRRLPPWSERLFSFLSLFFYDFHWPLPRCPRCCPALFRRVYLKLLTSLLRIRQLRLISSRFRPRSLQFSFFTVNDCAFQHVCPDEKCKLWPSPLILIFCPLLLKRSFLPSPSFA